jgi:hypothetical protein
MRLGGTIESRYGVDDSDVVLGRPPAPRPEQYRARAEYRWALKNWRRQYRQISGFEVLLILVMPIAGILIGGWRLFRLEVTRALVCMILGGMFFAMWFAIFSGTMR